MGPSLRWGDVDREETEPSLLDPFKSNVAIQAAVLVPFGMHFHMQIEMDLHAHELGQFKTCRLSNGLNPRAAFAQNDGALGRARY